MRENLKQWLFNKMFKEEIEEYKEIIKELCKDLENEALDNMCNINAVEKLAKELKEAKDMNDMWEKEVDRLENELRISNLIIQSMKLYQK